MDTLFPTLRGRIRAGVRVTVTVKVTVTVTDTVTITVTVMVTVVMVTVVTVTVIIWEGSGWPAISYQLSANSNPTDKQPLALNLNHDPGPCLDLVLEVVLVPVHRSIPLKLGWLGLRPGLLRIRLVLGLRPGLLGLDIRCRIRLMLRNRLRLEEGRSAQLLLQ